jgi:hypothetical protein
MPLQSLLQLYSDINWAKEPHVLGTPVIVVPK